MRSVRSQTSSNALSARVSTCSVDPEARVWCISAWSIGIRSRVFYAFSFCTLPHAVLSLTSHVARWTGYAARSFGFALRGAGRRGLEGGVQKSYRYFGPLPPRPPLEDTKHA